MMLGILLHAASVYTVSATWIVSDVAARSMLFDYVVWAIHTFRMPAFFILSGLLLSRSVYRRGVEATFQKMRLRTGVPLLVVLFLVNTVEVGVVYASRGQTETFPSYAAAAAQRGEWISHLWFLVYLLGFHLCIRTLCGLFRSKASAARHASEWLARHSVAIPLIAAAADIVVRAGARIFSLTEVSALNLSLFDWLTYLPFYALGCLIGVRRETIAEFSTLRAAHVWMAVIGGGILLARSSNDNGPLAAAISRFCATTLVWLLCIACFALFRRYCDQPRAFVRNVSQSGYTVYLLHHFTVVCLGLVLISSDLPSWAKFVTVVVSTALFTYLLHRRLIRRWPTLEFFLNGVRR